MKVFRRKRINVQRRRRPNKTSGQIEKETLKKRITNIEVRYSIIIIFEKRLSAAIPNFIIGNFLFDILRFAVSTMHSLILCIRIYHLSSLTPET